jgi:hypothetical protein
MKTVVSVNEISEIEIKPKAVLAEWQKLAEEEMIKRWSDKTEWVNVSCPVCKSDDANTAFTKQGFDYAECNRSKTLYARTRPSENELSWWYTQSDAINFWQTRLLTLSAASREEKIIEPRAHWILDGLSEYIPNLQLKNIIYTDISFFGKTLVEKIAEGAEEMIIIAAGITAGNENYAPGKVKVHTTRSIHDLSNLEKTDVLVAIDVLERVTSISELLARLESVVNPGGLVFATCPVASGFEIQSLWDKSPTITPPDKLNLPSVKGLIDHISNQWKILELSTPGMFDVELIRRTMLQQPGNWPRSLHGLLDNIDQQGIEYFTEYLQSQRLSSFARIVLRREDSKI